MDWLKNCEPEVMTCESHIKNQQKLQKYSAVAQSGANALYFDHISHLSWEPYIKSSMSGN